jgi:hypothetical protein
MGLLSQQFIRINSSGSDHYAAAGADLKGDIIMKICKIIIVVLSIIALLVVLSSCQEGPFERAGKKVDKTVDDIKK